MFTSPRLEQAKSSPVFRPHTPPVFSTPVTVTSAPHRSTVPVLTPTTPPTSLSPVTEPETEQPQMTPAFSPHSSPTEDLLPPGAATPSTVRFLTVPAAPISRNSPIREPFPVRRRPVMAWPFPSKVP